MDKIKKIIYYKCDKRLVIYLMLLYKYNRQSKSMFKTFLFAFKTLIKFYVPSKKLTNAEQVKKVLNKAKITINEKEQYIYDIDEFKTIYKNDRVIDNTTVDYSKILENSLNDLKDNAKKLKNSEYRNEQIKLLNSIESLVDKEIEVVEKSSNINKDKIIQNLKNIKNKSACSFEEAIQRILFFNQIQWQISNGMAGLGRLDKILIKYYAKDIEDKAITKDNAKKLIKEMFFELHKKYWFKSNVLLGDTGQIIILGGKNPDNTYFCNDLTYLFIEVIKEVQLPDPKALLRVSSETPRDLIELALKCIQTGVGCPLLSNDDAIITKLEEYGYSHKDACNYVTAACWEPLIYGKSISPNNIDTFNFMIPFNEMFEKENISELNNIDFILEKYNKYLEDYLADFFERLNGYKWEKSTFLSLFTENCNEKQKDVSEGGAVYNNFGVTSVALGNLVNSVLNINKYVFEEKQYSLEKLNQARQSNYKNEDKLLKFLKDNELRFGSDDKKIIDLSNKIIDMAKTIISTKTNSWGGKYKFGLSAPTYIIQGKNVAASFDGRKNGEPFLVHISSDKSLPYTELVQFAAKIDYSGPAFNGNVVDFMVNPSFIEKNFNKMLDFLILSIKIGFFQMQMNVINSDILIKAKNNPSEFPNLIVRVWGFSAYFNDLSEEYKNLLIERALKSEGENN